MSGTIILLNGASSAGKSTLARSLQARLPLPFWHWSIDHLHAAQVLPWQRIGGSGEFPWAGAQREAFFDGFHRSIAAFASAGTERLIAAWSSRRTPSAFARMRAELAQE